MEDFTRRLLYPAATAKTLKKITQVYRAGERTSEGCRVLLLQRGVGIIRSRWWRVLVYIVDIHATWDRWWGRKRWCTPRKETPAKGCAVRNDALVHDLFVLLYNELFLSRQD